MVATVGLLEIHVNVSSSSVELAVREEVWPGRRTSSAGVTSIPTPADPAMVTNAVASEPLTLPRTVMVVSPTATPVTKPALLTRATSRLADVQTKLSWGLLESARSRALREGRRRTAVGVTFIAPGTVAGTVAVNPLLLPVTVMVALPSETPVNNPLTLTETTPELLEENVKVSAASVEVTVSRCVSSMARLTGAGVTRSDGVPVFGSGQPVSTASKAIRTAE